MRKNMVFIIFLVILGICAGAISISQGQRRQDEGEGPYRVYYIDQASVGEKKNDLYGDLEHVRRALNELHKKGLEFVAYEYITTDRLMVVCRK